MKLSFLIAVVCTLFACNNANNGVVFKQNEKDNTEKIAVYTSEDDKMNAAIDSAKHTFPYFLQQLEKPCEECTDFSVKMKFSFGEDNGEHIWLSDLFCNKNKLFGIIANEPENDVHVEFGDTIEVDQKALSDWMYLQEDKLIGGYTIKVIYYNSPQAERKRMENELGARIE
jgi:uncharacterized protein YegJ (DUF2314 family)